MPKYPGSRPTSPSFAGWAGAATSSRFDRIQIDRTKELTTWAERVRRFLDDGVEVYGYFNNHFAGHSPASLRQFWRSSKRSRPSPARGEPKVRIGPTRPAAYTETRLKLSRRWRMGRSGLGRGWSMAAWLLAAGGMLAGCIRPVQVAAIPQLAVTDAPPEVMEVALEPVPASGSDAPANDPTPTEIDCHAHATHDRSGLFSRDQPIDRPSRR